MKNKILILAILIIAFSTIGFGQEAIKIDEFGSPNCEDLMARLDALAIEIQNTDGTSYGFVVIYEGKYERYVYDKKSDATLKTFLPMIGEANLLGETIRKYLVESRGISKTQLMIVSGGFREKHTVELWLVSRSGKAPEITPTLDTIKYRKGNPAGICDGS